MAAEAMGFLEVLQSFRRGELLARCDEELARVLDAVAETGGKGELVLRLPFKINKAGQVEITPQVSAKIPERALSTGLYWVSDEGRLSRRDPAQAEMFDDISARRAAKE